MALQGQEELIDYDHLELDDPNASGLLPTDALKLGSASAGLGAMSNSTTGYNDNDIQR